MEKSMMLITSSWGSNKTFKMIPTSLECPYAEVIFDFDSKVLAVIGKDSKESFHMLTKLNEWGDPVMLKIGKRNNGKDYAEERKSINTFYEYYIEDQSEIEQFVKIFAINADKFSIDSYFAKKEDKQASLIQTV